MRINNQSRVYLIGPMGAGKTSVGRELSFLLGYKFIDSDQIILEQEKNSISHIFKTFGEDYFRHKESALLYSLIQQENIVLATGGGAVLLPCNRLLLQYSGTVIYLHLSIAEQIRRLKTSPDRPLLPESLEDWPIFLANYNSQREPLYTSIADHTFATEGKNIKKLAEHIASCV